MRNHYTKKKKANKTIEKHFTPSENKVKKKKF